MKYFIAIAVLAALAGCANAPKSRDPTVLLQDTTSPDVVRHQAVVAVPFERAYRNVLRQARSCWARAGVTGLASARWTVDTDFDLTQRTAMIYVTDPGVWHGSVFTVVELRGQGEKTLIKGAAVRLEVGTLPGAPEVPHLARWAAGEKAPCASPDWLL